MDRTKFDNICRELEVPEELVEHIWVVHPPPAGATDEQLRMGLKVLVAEQVIGALLSKDSDGLAA